MNSFQRSGLQALGWIVLLWVLALLAVLSVSQCGDVRAADKEIASAVPFEAEIAPKVIRTEAGNNVRVVGLAVRGYQSVTDTPQGRVVILEAEEAPLARVECNVVIQAAAKPDGTPDTPGLEAYFGQSSTPVLVAGSCSYGTCRWAWLARGAGCVAVADSLHMVASTINEMLELPLGVRVFVLVAEGTCDDGAGPYSCLVPVEHPDATPGGTVQFAGTDWMGRPELNYVKAPAGVPEERYDVPDGGFPVEEVVP